MSLAWMLYFGLPDMGALMPRLRFRRAPAFACHSSYREFLNISPYCSVVASRPTLSITSANVISTYKSSWSIEFLSLSGDQLRYLLRLPSTIFPFERNSVGAPYETPIIWPAQPPRIL